MQTPNRLNSDLQADDVVEERGPHNDSGLRALARVAMHLSVVFDPGIIAHELGVTGRRATVEELMRAAAMVGLRAQHLSGRSRKDLQSTPRPAILKMKDGRYITLDKLPIAAGVEEDWAGEMIVITGNAAVSAPDASLGFGLRWLVHRANRYRKVFSQVLFASVFVQLFALITPTFFQVIIDKVLVHSALSTLTVVTLAMITLGAFETTLQYLRSYALAHTGTRLGLDLGRQSFAHLLKLPLAFFERFGSGEIAARINEIERIKTFVTGSGLMSIIDIAFAAAFFALLLVYSATLTLVVIATVPLYSVTVFWVRPRLIRAVQESFAGSAACQHFLVESVIGIHTLKSAAIEPLMRMQWDKKRAVAAQASFQSQILTQFGANLTQFVSKLTTALILYFGARLVIARELTVGELVAFNMVAGQAVAPVLRLSQLWQEYQQARNSLARLGDIMRSEPELQSGLLDELPRMRGAIRLRDVTFRYDPGSPDVLQQVSLDIPAGQVIGIVGPSGSGKSTLTKLIQRLCVPCEGVVEIDGHDVNDLHPAWLRRQIGVVLQENLLFDRTIHENIAIAVPDLSREQVIAAAKLAGADEFITRFPRGYDTRIIQRGANLSGGQRQRIAIARALASDPRVLVLDEATSAVDYESERVIQTNLREIVRGRTVILIAHRLVTVRHCDRIIGMVGGRIVEEGCHDELVLREKGLYRYLWSLQSDPGRVHVWNP